MPAGETLDTAIEEGRDDGRLAFRLPPEAAPAVLRYNQLLDEANEYCRRAELLTIAPSDEAVSVRGWAFGQMCPSVTAKRPRLGLSSATSASLRRH